MLAHLNSIIHILGAKFCFSTYVMCHRRSNMTQYLWYLSGVGALDKKAGGEIDGTEMELFPLSYSLDSTLLYLGNLYILIQEMYIHKTKFLYFIQVRKKFFLNNQNKIKIEGVDKIFLTIIFYKNLNICSQTDIPKQLQFVWAATSPWKCSTWSMAMQENIFARLLCGSIFRPFCIKFWLTSRHFLWL